MANPRWRPKTLVSIFALMTLLLSSGADAASKEMTALVGGRLIDGTGGRPIPDSVILIEGERILSIGQVETLAPG